MSVYITEARRTVPPSGVFDAVLTGERWIIPPVKLSLIGVIPLSEIEWAQDGLEPWGGIPEYEAWNRRAVRMKRYTQVVRGHLPHAHEAWVEAFAKKVAMFFQRKMAEMNGVA